MQQGEEVLAEKNANLMERLKAIGGQLILTGRRVIFEPASIDPDTGTIIIPMEEIREAKRVNTLGLIPNGLELELNSGRKYRFAVEKRKEVFELLQEQEGKRDKEEI